MDYASITNEAYLKEFGSIERNDKNSSICHARYSNAVEQLGNLVYEMDTEHDQVKKASVLHQLNVQIIRTHIEFLMFGISMGFDPHRMHAELFSALQQTPKSGIIPTEQTV